MQHKLAFFILFAVTVPALAAAPRASTKYSTRDEYRACMDERDLVDSTRTDFDAQLAAHEAKQKQFSADKRAHRTKVNADSIINFADAKSDALHARSVALNAETEKLNAASNDLNALVTSHNQRCSGMVVSMPDRDAVLKERAKLGKKIY